MSYGAVREIRNRALTHASFRRHLTEPDDAMAGLNLTPEETAALRTIQLKESGEGGDDLNERRSKFWPLSPGP